MADSFANTIIANSTWQNAAATYTAASNAKSWVQNRGPKNILVAHSSSATPPNDGGIMLLSNEIASGNSQFVWVKSLGDSSKFAIGLAD